MGGFDPLKPQKAELESILSSEAFARAPNLAKLLRFLCQKHWEGKASEVKEYVLAVEVLGRHPDFDPTTNSIVRVELHRLREKLTSYYLSPGVHHEFRIHLRAGSYDPEFLPAREQEITAFAHRDVPGPGPALEPQLDQRSASPPRELETPTPTRATPLAGSRGTLRRFPLRFRLWMAGLTVGVVLLLSLWRWRAFRSPHANSALSPAAFPSATVTPPAPSSGIKIMAGYTKGKYYVDRLGETWLSDRYFDGGAPISFPRQVTALATDPALFETARMGRFAYTIPLSPGSYEVRLYFMERLIGPRALGQGGENSRLFDVLLNGKTALSSFDPYSDAGGNLIAHIRAFKGVTPSSDGFLRIKFFPSHDEPFVNAIEIIPTADGSLPPIRIAAQENSDTDVQGRVWEPDRYYRGGVLLRRQAAVRGSADPDLFGGERYGHFSYVIPVPEGTYGLTLYFAEAYFGSLDGGAGGIGSRVFDLYCNGQALLRDFDVFREAGGPNRALVKPFHGLRPNPQGQLALDFVPAKNYALINAIEVVDESRNK